MSYPARTNALLKHGLGLWDVYAARACAGNFDAAIRHAWRAVALPSEVL